MRNLILFLSILILLSSLSDAQDFWQQSNGPHTGRIGHLAINSSGYIFAQSNSGVYRSTDNGKNWELTGLSGTGIMSLAIKSNGDLFAGTTDGVFRSTDNGDNWLLQGLTDEWIVSIAFNSSGHIFAGVYCLTSPDGGGVYCSTDNGENWTHIGLKSNWVNSFAINSNGHIFAGTQNNGVFRSTDNGNSWTQLIKSGLTSIRSLTVNSSGHIFAGTAGSGVFRSVRSTTSIKGNNNQMPSSFELSQNYPNPFNPVTKLNIVIPYEDNIKLSICNSLVQIIEVIAKGRLSAGNYSFYWNASNHPSGIYYYTLEATKFNATKKCILMK